MRMILGSVGVGLAALAKRLVKLASRFVLSGARPHRLDHVLHRVRQRLHLVGESFDVEEQERSAPARAC
jgi:short-subunit dehydrogenase involved in D-alanine esterification of teichoic acids